MQQKKSAIPIEWTNAYDDIGVAIYAMDIETYNVIYENKVALSFIGNVIGKKCYSSIRGFSEPCPDCVKTQDLPFEACSVTKNRYIPSLDRYFNVHERLIHWFDGRLTRFGILIDVTAENKLVLQNRQKDAMLKLQSAFIESCTMLMGAITPEEEAIFINKACSEATGHSREELTALGYSGMFTSEDVEYLQRKVLPDAFAGKQWRGEMSITAKDGKVIPVRQTVFPVYDDEETLVAIAGIGEDITKERAMEEIKQLHLAIMDSAIDYISVSDLDKNVIYNSPGAYKMLGYGEDVDINSVQIEMVHSDEYSKLVINTGIPTAMREGHWTGKGDLRRKDGSVIPIEQLIFPVFKKNNELIGVATIIRDISSLVESEKILKDQLRQQKFISSFLMNLTEVSNFDELIQNSLNLIRDLLKVDEVLLCEDDVDSQSFSCRYTSLGSNIDVNDHQIMSYKEDMDAYTAYRKELFFLTQDALEQPKFIPAGTKKSLLVAMRVENEYFGTLYCGVRENQPEWSESDLNLTNIAAKMLAGALSRNNNQRRLTEAMHRAEEASRAKGDFLSRMSHEIRTPMNAIIGMTKIGKEARDEEKMLYCLGKIDDASRHLLGLLNDILDMAKIEANKLDLFEEAFNLERMLDNISTVIAVKAEEKKIKFVTNIAHTVPREVIGDELRLSQVLTNLLSNAVKFTPDFGNVELNISVEPESGENEKVFYVEVKDTGIGIPPEQIDKLFTVFEQVEGGIARRFGGTGLGLAISKKIVGMMGGRIGVTSEPGKGSCFYFTVKLKPAEVQDKEKYACCSAYPGLRALVINDSLDDIDYFKRIMGEWGISCDFAHDSHKGMELVKHAVESGKTYHIIFLDYNIKGAQVVDISQQLKGVMSGSTIVVTAPASFIGRVNENIASNAISVVIKRPIFSSNVLDVINNVVLGKASSHTHDKNNAENSQHATFSRCRVLIVDDIEINREIAMSLLEGTQIMTDCAENGQEAIRMFKDNQEGYDIIFMDVHMPVMDGLEATAQIRALGTAKARSVPIIAMTAHAFKEDVEACMEAGMSDHVGKPIDLSELLLKMSNYLRGKED